MTTSANSTLPETEALVVSLDEYIRARYSLIAVQTFEEERFLRFMRTLAGPMKGAGFSSRKSSRQ